ncbi:MAG: adenylate/guanylate cyclase domain-containing protein, partial [Verrucomicrobiota bacterium]
QAARGKGGTAHNLSQWIANGVQSENIWRDPDRSESFVIRNNSIERSHRLSIDTNLPPVHLPNEAPFQTSGQRKETKAILFADVSGYTRLPEIEIPQFVSSFLGLCSKIMKCPEFMPDVTNTWGDALFAIFPTTQMAASFSKTLIQEAEISDSFSVELSLRIGLHAGPLYECQDPIQNCTTFTGSHVSLAARLEPIAEKGQIYASEYFAALAKIEEGNDCKFEFLGEKTLGKNYKAMRVYKVM